MSNPTIDEAITQLVKAAEQLLEEYVYHYDANGVFHDASQSDACELCTSYQEMAAALAKVKGEDA